MNFKNWFETFKFVHALRSTALSCCWHKMWCNVIRNIQFDVRKEVTNT